MVRRNELKQRYRVTVKDKYEMLRDDSDENDPGQRCGGGGGVTQQMKASKCTSNKKEEKITRSQMQYLTVPGERRDAKVEITMHTGNWTE